MLKIKQKLNKKLQIIITITISKSQKLNLLIEKFFQDYYLFIILIFFNSLKNKFAVFSSILVNVIDFKFFGFSFTKNCNVLSTIIGIAFSLGKQKIPLEIATNATD